MNILKHTQKPVYHIVNSETGRSLCNRDASSWSTASFHGYSYNWSQPDGYQRCTRCGSVEDFQAVTDADYERYQARQAWLKTIHNEATRLANDKAAILKNQIWPALVDALNSAGLEVNEEQPRGELDRGHALKVSAVVNGHSFNFRIDLPPTEYGVNQSEGTLHEQQPYWVKR